MPYLPLLLKQLLLLVALVHRAGGIPRRPAAVTASAVAPDTTAEEAATHRDAGTWHGRAGGHEDSAGVSWGTQLEALLLGSPAPPQMPPAPEESEPAEELLHLADGKVTTLACLASLHCHRVWTAIRAGCESSSDLPPPHGLACGRVQAASRCVH